MFCRNYLQFNRQFWYFVLFCRSALLCRFNIPASKPNWHRGQIIRPQPRPHSSWPQPRSGPHGISGLSLIEIGIVASIFTVHMTLINIHNITIDNHFCGVLVAYWKLCSGCQYLSLHAHTHSKYRYSLTCLAALASASFIWVAGWEWDGFGNCWIGK